MWKTIAKKSVLWCYNMGVKYKLFAILGALAVVFVATPVFAYQRTIVNPATNSSLSSATMRAELQALENEITSHWTIGNGTFSTTSAGTVGNFTITGTCTGCGGFGYPFVGDATSTLINFSTGLKSASTTLTGLFAFGNATGTNATTTNFFATTASSTNLFGANLSACTGTNALTWSGGLFSCTAQAQGTVTSVTGTWPIISSGGTTPNLTFGGLSTSSAAIIGNLPYFSGVNTFANVATTTLTGTANQISVSNSPVVIGASGAVLTLPNHVIFPAGGYEAAIGSTTNSTSTNVTATGYASTTGLTVSNTRSALGLFSATGALSAYGGASACSSNNFVTTISGVGGTTCGTASVTVTAGTGLSGGGAVALGAAVTLNNAIGFPFTSVTTYNTASNGTTTPIWFENGLFASSTATKPALVYDSASSTGEVEGTDVVNSWGGRITPTRSFVLSTATTTTWGGTTTPSYVPFLVMPFAGTLRDMRCLATSTQAFLGIAPRINGTKTTPSYTVASTTVGQTKFTSNNTFTAGQRIDIYVGTTTTDANATGVSCTFTTTETP